MSISSIHISSSDAAPRCNSITSDEVRLLAAIGFLAAKSGCVAPAIRIFESLGKLRPGAVFPFIGLSIAYIAVGMHPEAMHVLTERAADACNDDDSLFLWRSLAFHQSGNRSGAAAALQTYLSGPSADGLHGLADKLTKELGLRTSIPDWPSPAVVSDQETAF